LIAEGHGRFSYPDQIHFCAGKGIIGRNNESSEIILEEYRMKLKEPERMLNGYITYLRTKGDLESTKPG